jgi:hypothetical protein
MPNRDKLGFVRMVLKLPHYLFLFFDWINKIILNKLFQTAPFIYSLLAIVCIVFAIIILIILFFARFNLIPRNWKDFISKTVAQQIYSTLHLISSFFILSAIVFLTFYKDINITSNQTTRLNMLSNIINNNTAGVIILQVIIISIIVVLVFLMSVISNGLSKAYYGLKAHEVNETPSLLWWAQIVDLLMYGCCIISSILLIFFFIAKLLIPNIPVFIKSSIQTFFVVSIVYVLSQLFLQMLRDIVSNNILSFVVPNTHRDKMLFFVLNILLAIIIWLCVSTLISYNIYGFIQVLRSSNKVLSTANKITPIFYGVIPPSVNEYIEPLIAKLGIDPNKLTNLPREYVKLEGLAEIPPLEPPTLQTSPQTVLEPPTLQTSPQTVLEPPILQTTQITQPQSTQPQSTQITQPQSTQPQSTQITPALQTPQIPQTLQIASALQPLSQKRGQGQGQGKRK